MGCSDDSNYGKPMPWIGLYIAIASMICALAMATDVLLGLRIRTRLSYPNKVLSVFPTNYFTLNAATLTLTGVALKLPMDLNTNVPRWEDQFTKLSGTTFLCTVIANVLPSLGKQRDRDMLSNAIALGLTTITVMVNIGIQMGTGVIFAFRHEHVTILCILVLLLVNVGSSMFSLFTRKPWMEDYCTWKCKYLPWFDKDCPDYEAELKEKIQEYWLLSHTSNGEYVQGRSPQCSASGVYCIVSTLILLQAGLRSVLLGEGEFCKGKSDYEWSTRIILVSQCFGIAVGTIAPACRWLNSVNFIRTNSEFSCYCSRRVDYWPHIYGTWLRSALTSVDLLCRLTQQGIIMSCKFIGLALAQPIILLQKFMIPIISIGIQRYRGESRPASSPNVSSTACDFVVLLDDECKEVDWIVKRGYEAVEKWIQRGKINQPSYFLVLLNRYFVGSRGFKGVGEFDSQRVESILSPELPKSFWTLPLMVLLNVAFRLPGTDQNKIEELEKGVYEGLRYVELVEKHISGNEMFSCLTKFSEIEDWSWKTICAYTFPDRDHHEQHENAQLVIQKLSESMKKRAQSRGGGGFRDHYVFVANSMYRITQTILIEHQSEIDRVEDLLQWISTTIADIFVACLTNLLDALLKECVDNIVKDGERSARRAAELLGETEIIREIIRNAGETPVDKDDRMDLNKWYVCVQNKV